MPQNRVSPVARIIDSKGRDDENSGYTRLLGIPDLGRLLSRIHATVIRNGNELEAMLADRCPFRATGLHDRVSGALRLLQQPVEAYFGEALHVSIDDHRTIADVVVLHTVHRRVRVIEIKDGDVFDTKKADGELSSLRPVAAMIGRRLGYEDSYHLCCFNQDDKQAIMRGMKGRFSEEQVMTGRELADLLAVDYDEIRRKRHEDIRANIQFFADSIADIAELREALARRLS